MKKLVSILMAAVLLLCAVPVLAEGQTYTVGVCQLVTHDALDAATQGFIDALTEELGDAVTFDVQNAAGDSNTCSTIVNSFVAADVDLILPTPPLRCRRPWPRRRTFPSWGPPSPNMA